MREYSKSEENIKLEKPLEEQPKLPLRKKVESDKEETFVINLIAVYGKPIDFEILRGLTMFSPTHLLEILQKLIKVELISREVMDGKYFYQFCRQSIRENIYKKMGILEKKELHLTIGKFLEESENVEDVLPDIAYNLLKGGDTRIDKVMDYALRAGDRFIESNSIREAIEIYETIHKKLGDRIGDEKNRLIFYNLGKCYVTTGSYDKALEYYTKSQEGKENKKEWAGIYRQLGNLELKSGNLTKALELLELSKEFLKDDEDYHEQARVYRVMANIYIQMCEYSTAIKIAQTGLKLIIRKGENREEAMLDNALANAYFHQKNYSKAKQYFQQSLKLYEGLQDSRGIAISLHGMGMICEMENKYVDAIGFYQRSLQIAEGTGDDLNRAIYLTNLGALYHCCGEYSKAIEYYRMGINLFSDFGNMSNWARVTLNLSCLLKTIGELREAERLALGAIKIANDAEIKLLEGYGHLILGSIEKSKGNIKATEKHYLDSIDILSALGKNSSELCQAEFSLANMYLETGDRARAKERLDSALKLAKELNYPHLLARYYIIAEKLVDGEISRDEGRSLLFSAMECLDKLNDIELNWELNFSCGNLLKRFGARDNADEYYIEAGKIIKKIASSIPEELQKEYLDEPSRKIALEEADNVSIHKEKLEDEEKLVFDNIIGSSSQMNRVFKQLKMVIETDLTVLIVGETGTGKELIARAIHSGGKRKDKLFVAQNCSSMPDALLESELFGHKKGAFTGAINDKIGLFELANGGTIFLDEIGDTSPAFQAKILRILGDGVIRPVGDVKTRKVDVRIVTATNKDLSEAIKKGQFRHDLYYRLNACTIALPPLRERRDDIPLLVNYFIDKFSKLYRKKIDAISPLGLSILEDYSWPGNVRELENSIERAVVMCKGNEILPADLPKEILSQTPLSKIHGKGGQDILSSSDTIQSSSNKEDEEILPFEDYILKAKKDIIRKALEKSNWNRVETAKILKINRSHLYYLIKTLKIES